MTINFTPGSAPLGSPELSKILGFDAVAEAENITGEHKTELSNMLAVALQVSAVGMKNRILESLEDTTFSMSMDAYLAVVENLGFVRILDVPFTVECDMGGNIKMPIEENQYVYWSAEKSALLVTDTSSHYAEKLDQKIVHRNGAKLYFEADVVSDDLAGDIFQLRMGTSIRFHDDNQRWFDQPRKKEDYFFEFNSDARQGLRHIFAQLEGKVIYRKQWVLKDKHPKFLWLCHHGDTNVQDFNSKRVHVGEKSVRLSSAIRAERLALLPPEVQSAIGASQWIAMTD